MADLIFTYQFTRGSKDNVIIFLSMGDGRRFRRANARFVGTMTEIIAIVMADIDNDGKRNDLIWIDNTSMLFTFSSIVFTEPEYVATYETLPQREIYAYPSKMIKGRFNNDEFDDLALISPQSDTLQILIPYKYFDHEMLLSYNQLIYLTENHPTSITRGNFNNDLIDDLAVLSCNGTVSIFLGTPSGFFDRKFLRFGTNEYRNGKCCQSLIGADLNQDGIDDLIFIDPAMNTIRLFLGSSCDE